MSDTIKKVNRKYKNNIKFIKTIDKVNKCS